MTTPLPRSYGTVPCAFYEAVLAAPNQTLACQMNVKGPLSFQGEVTVAKAYEPERDDGSDEGVEPIDPLGRITITYSNEKERKSATVDMYFDFEDVTSFVVPRAATERTMVVVP